MANNGKIYKLMWYSIPDQKTEKWHSHTLGTYVIDQDGSMPLSEVHVKAVEQISDSLYKKNDWAECRGPFTYFSPEKASMKVLKNGKLDFTREHQETMGLVEYLIATQPDVKEVTNMVIVSSALDG